MKGRHAAVTAAWAAVAAVAGALGAWTLAGFDGAAGDRGRPLDEAAVRRALASPPPEASSAPAPSNSTSEPPRTREPSSAPEHTAPPPPRRSTLRFAGGTATAECRADGTVYLTSWSPADGYHVEEYARGPARTARLELEPSAEDADDVEYEISCGRAAKATATRAPEDAD